VTLLDPDVFRPFDHTPGAQHSTSVFCWSLNFKIVAVDWYLCIVFVSVSYSAVANVITVSVLYIVTWNNCNCEPQRNGPYACPVNYLSTCYRLTVMCINWLGQWGWAFAASACVSSAPSQDSFLKCKTNLATHF